MGVALLTIAVIAGCGSSKPRAPVNPSAQARILLRQTFAAGHRVRSGVLAVTVALTPTTSAGGPNPISFTLEGPFQNHGGRRSPDADFNVSISARHRTGSLSLVSAGGAGYVTIGTDSYELPISSRQMLDSTTANSPTSTGPSPLGIRPQDWIVDPQVVGSDRIGGASTTRIHAKVDAEKLVADLSALLPKLSSLGLSSSLGQLSNVVGGLPKRLSAADQRQLAAELHEPYVDLWTGSSDHILRKLILSFEIPAGAKVVGKAGGGPHVVTLTLQYSDLNRSQTIAAPGKTQPYTALKAKVNDLAQQLGVGTTPTTPKTDTTRDKHHSKSNQPPELTLSPYAQCVANAAGDFTKMQRCASLSNGTSTRGTSTRAH